MYYCAGTYCMFLQKRRWVMSIYQYYVGPKLLTSPPLPGWAGRPKLHRHSNITSKYCSSFQTALSMLAGGGLNGLIWAGPHSAVWGEGPWDHTCGGHSPNIGSRVQWVHTAIHPTTLLPSWKQRSGGRSPKPSSKPSLTEKAFNWQHKNINCIHSWLRN